MASKNYRKQETRYFIGRINKRKERETLRMETYNSLPSALRDRFEIGRGFESNQTANQGVNFFNSVEKEKGEGRDFLYLLVDLINTEEVAINDNTDDIVKEYIKDLEEGNLGGSEEEPEASEESIEEKYMKRDYFI